MADIWSGIGADISSGGGGDEWLYKVNGQVRGPVPASVVAQKLASGEIDIRGEVAKEGGEWHPVTRVAAFQKHITEAKKQAQKRAAQKMRKIVLLLSLPILLGMAGGGYVMYQSFEKSKQEKELARKAKEGELAKLKAAAESAPEMGLVALVSLGTEDSVKIKKQEAPKTTTKKTGRTREREEPEQMVAQCKLSQAEIFGTLKKHLAKLNVCVEDEKSRDTQGLLPPQLELEFVVQTSGKVTDFEIQNRHYRKGPMNNCMIKAFMTISFPSSNGANCPVAIPIKIGKG